MPDLREQQERVTEFEDRQNFFEFVENEIRANAVVLRTEPPTPQSLELAAKMGVMFGRKLYEAELNGSFDGVRQIITDHLASHRSVHGVMTRATREGYEASSLDQRFRYVNVTVDFGE